MSGESESKSLPQQWKKAVLLVCALIFLFPHALFAANDKQTTTDIYERLLGGERVLAPRDYVAPAEPTVYLSFDDGPSDLTPQVLDILKREEVPATFFVLGSLAEKRGELVKRIASEGHALGNHTYIHNYDELYSSFEAFWEQIRRTERILEETAGVKPLAIRAPGGTHGHFDPFYFYYLDRAGYRLFDWNVDSGDARQRNVPADQIIGNVKNSRLTHETHVLMHDSAGHEETVKALPEVIQYFKKLGYRFAIYDESVKPVMFTQGKPRHNRRYDRTGHERMVLAAEGAAKERLTLAAADGAEAGRMVEVAAAGGTDQHGPVMHSLTVITGSREISLASDQYTIENGRLLVPLRAFTESLGGKVEWDAKQRTGNAYYGGSHLSFDPVRKQVQVTREGGRPETLAMPDLGFINGSIYVPIREIASLYNYKIADYSVHENVRFVRLAEILTPELSFGQLYRNMNNSYAQAWLIVRQYLSSLTTIVAQWSLKFRWV